MTPSIVYRALVTYSNTSTGEIRVVVPAVAGQSELSISYIGREIHSGSWSVPAVGDQIVVSADDENLTNLFWIHTDSIPSTGGGASVLNDLLDVVVTNPLRYETLQYNGTEWVNTEASVATYVRNAEATTLEIGEVVYLYQQQGDRASVKRAINTSDATSAKTLGVVATQMAPSTDGVVVTQGYVYNCNLGTFTPGQTVYLGSTAGTLTATKPSAPNHLVYIGVVVRANNGNGIIYVRAQNGYELDEIHDVAISSPTTGDFLKWNGSLWVNDPINLGTDTTGNYMSGVSAGTGVTVTHTPGEGSTATVAIGQSVATTVSPSFAGLNIVNGATTNGTISQSSGNISIYATGDISVGSQFGATFSGINATIQGFGILGLGGVVTIQATGGADAKIVLDAPQLNITNDGFVLNSAVTGSPTLNATMEVERGTSTNVAIRWNETTDKWELTNNGSTYESIQTAQSLFGFRNAIINGDFSINQRALTSSGVTASGTYGFDRWRNGNSGGTATYSAQTFTLGNAITGYEPTNYARMVTASQSASGDYAALLQKIESVRTFAGQQITVSFWAQAGSGTPKIAVELIQSFGTGGTPSADVTTYAGQVTLSTTWTRYSVTVTVPSISGKTLGTAKDDSLILQLWTSAGSNFNSRTGSMGIQNTTINFWGVQVEKGSEATQFEQRPIAIEQSLCNRYCYRIDATANSYFIATSYFGGSGAYIHVDNVWRATPAITWGSTSNWVYYDNPSGDITATASATGISANAAYWGVLTDGQQSGILFRNTSGTYILFTAEL